MSSESALLESEWRQGTVLPHKLVPEGALPASATIDTKLVVISHDCDLVNASYEAEPYVEFFVARLMPDTARDGRLFNGKNPRRYQFFAEDSGARRLYEVDVHEKYRIPRRTLEGGTRDQTITINSADVRNLGKWAMRRYHRPSLPTAFLNRVSNAAKSKMSKKLEREGEDVLGVYLGFNSVDELRDGEPYRIIVRVVVSAEASEDEVRERRALSVVAEVQKLLAQCPDISVEDADVVSEMDFSMYDLRTMVKWDFDYLSPEETVRE